MPHLSGALLCTLLSVVAIFVASTFQLPVMIVALCVGLIFSKLYSISSLVDGINFCARPLLYVGVALLGIRIDAAEIFEAGIAAPLLSIAALVITLIVGLLFSKLLKINRQFGVLISGAVAICGVSAAAAICCALPDCKSRERELALTIAGITVLSSIAMLLYPAISYLLELNDFAAGAFFGASIHNVSQVVGAGYAISPESGDVATFVKMIRVSALLPVIMIIGIAYGRNSATTSSTWRTYFPPFLIGFFILAALNSLHIFPENISALGSKISKTFLVVSLLGIGLKTNIFDILKVGPRPLIVMTLTTAFMAMFVLGSIYFLQSINLFAL